MVKLHLRVEKHGFCFRRGGWFGPWSGGARLGFLLAVLLGLVSAAHAQISTEYYHPPFNLFSPQDDIQVGRQAEAQALQKMPILRNAAANSYITRLGLRLSAHMPGPRFPYRFHIVDQKQINAFALPGGPVFINTGAICAARNEAQLAGVVGHEESHVALRHSTSMASKQEAGGLVLGILGGVLGTGTAGQLARLGTEIGANFVFLKYSRTMESQADALGAQVMNSAGYNPVEMAHFFQIIEEQGGPQPAQFLSDHPNPGNRLEAIEREIPTLGSHPAYVDDSAQFEQIKHTLCSQNGGTPPGSASPRGNRSRPVPRSNSGGWASTSFQGLSIGYPSDWQIAGGGSSTQLTLAPSNGVAGDGAQGSILTGAIISVYQPAQAGSLAVHSRQLVDALRQSNPQMRIAGSAQRVQVDGIEGQSLLLDNQNTQGQAERDRLVTFPRQDGSVLYLIFIAPASDYGQQATTFDRILNSVRING